MPEAARDPTTFPSPKAQVRRPFMPRDPADRMIAEAAIWVAVSVAVTVLAMIAGAVWVGTIQ